MPNMGMSKRARNVELTNRKHRCEPRLINKARNQQTIPLNPVAY